MVYSTGRVTHNVYTRNVYTSTQPVLYIYCQKCRKKLYVFAVLLYCILQTSS